MNRVAFSIFGINIYFYSLCILCGIILAYFVITKEAKRQGIRKDKIVDLMFYCIIFGIIGARIYYCIFNFDYYINNITEVFAIWNGGLAIHGGIIAGLLTAFIFCKKKNLNFLQIVDIAVPGVILAQSFGRWGNFFNGEAHGAVTTLETLRSLKVPEFIINGMKIDDVYYYPTFYFESIWCIIGFIIMVILRKNKKIKTGFITGFYFIWYGIGRFFIESSRTDSLMLFNIKVAQLVSIIGIIVGIILIIYSFKSKKDIKEE